MSMTEFAQTHVLGMRLPLTGVKSPKSGKEGFGVKKSPSPTAPEKGVPSKKSPFLYRAPQGKWGFFDSERPLLGGGKSGFLTPQPFFPILRLLTPVRGKRIPKTCPETTKPKLQVDPSTNTTKLKVSRPRVAKTALK